MMNYYVHNVPGRLRIKIPLIKGDVDRGQEVLMLLQNCPGVETTSFNTVTGSLLVYYDPDKTHADEILDLLKEKGYFDETKAVTNEEYFQNAVMNAGGAVGRAVFGWAVGRAFEGAGLGFLAALI